MTTAKKSVSEMFAGWEALLAKADLTEAECKRMMALEDKIEGTPATNLAEMKMKMKLVGWLEGQGSVDQAASVCKNMVLDVMRNMKRQAPEPIQLAA